MEGELEKQIIELEAEIEDLKSEVEELRERKANQIDYIEELEGAIKDAYQLIK